MVNKKEDEKKYKIGYIMPISDTEPYKNGHWDEVKNILDDTIEEIKSEYKNYEITSQIVSEITDTNTLIHKSIVTNTYESDLIICDVSSKNPNVMFELGMRLAFDKPIILVKDDITDYSFDSGVLNHIDYKKDLNYVSIKTFQKELYTHIITMFSNPSSGRAGYLDSFGSFKVGSIEDKRLEEGEAIGKILEKLNSFENSIANLNMTPKMNERNKNENKVDFRKNKNLISTESKNFFADQLIDYFQHQERSIDVLTEKFVQDFINITLPEHNNIKDVQDIYDMVKVKDKILKKEEKYKNS